MSRFYGVDLLKTIAILCVLSGHFFVIHTLFKYAPFDSFSLFLQAAALDFFNCGVMLFLIITGFLNCHKLPTKSFYLKILRVIVPYLLISLLTILFRIFYLRESVNVLTAAKMILGFWAIPYGWYINMWIGLYLLIPFLNILYKGINSRKQSLLLLFTLAFISHLPATTNRLNFTLLPSYWIITWPLLYFFIGAHIRRFKPHYNPGLLMVLILATALFDPMVNCLFHAPSFHYVLCGAAGQIVIATALFLLLYEIKTPTSRVIIAAISKIAQLSLNIYLCSAIFDMLLYPWFKDQFYINQSQFGLFYFIIVPLVFLGSFLLAWTVDLFINILHINLLWERKDEKQINSDIPD